MLRGWTSLRSLFGGTGDPARVLESARLILSAPQPEDFTAWARLRRANREFLQPWEPRWPRDHLTYAAYRRRIRWARRRAEAGRAHTFLMRLRGGGEIVGGITLSNIRGGPVRSGTLGYWIGEAHARKGYTSEAVRKVVAFGVDELGLMRVEAACLQENAASRALLQRCGFSYEGIVRSYLEVNGVVRDHMLFSKVAGDATGD